MRLQLPRGPSKALTAIPTSTTAVAPMTLYQRNGSTDPHGAQATVDIPAMRPMKAPVPVARFVPIASMKTPSSEP